MTLREKLELDHPECIDENQNGGCKDCPSMYGYSAEDMCDCKTCTDELCRKCWDRKYEGELTPQEKKIEELNKKIEELNKIERLNRAHIAAIKSDRIYLWNKLRDLVDHIENVTGNYKGAFLNNDTFIEREFDEMIRKRDWWKNACVMSWVGFVIASIIIGFGG